MAFATIFNNFYYFLIYANLFVHTRYKLIAEKAKKKILSSIYLLIEI